jgi:hypothetical protein
MITDRLSITAALEFLKNSKRHEFSGDLTVPRSIAVIGKKSYKQRVTIGTTDTTVSLGDLANIGWVVFDNDNAVLPGTPGTPVITNVVIPTPASVVITNMGTAGAVTVTYKVQAVMANGDLSPASSAATTTTSNATLDSTNFNRITWDPVPGAVGYDIYRTVAPTTPSTTGKIAASQTGTVTVGGLYFDDTGLAGDGTTAPTFSNGATWTYKVVARNLDAFTVASAAGSTTTGRTLLSPNNYNLIKWLPIPDALSYDIYRTVSGGTPDETGFFLNVDQGSLFVDVDGIQYAFAHDEGVEGNGVSAPSTTPWDFRTEFGSNGTLYDVACNGGDLGLVRWNSAAIHGKALVNPTDVEITIIER